MFLRAVSLGPYFMYKVPHPDEEGLLVERTKIARKTNNESKQTLVTKAKRIQVSFPFDVKTHSSQSI